MRITKIEVDMKPSNCEQCIFYRLMSEDMTDATGWGGGLKECKLKIMMGYNLFGINLVPCPLKEDQNGI